MAKTAWNIGTGPKANSEYSFLKPGSIRDPGDVPAGWTFEFRAGVDEYQRMRGKTFLRIRKSSAVTASQVYWVYAGANYIGAFSSLPEAVTAAEAHKPGVTK